MAGLIVVFEYGRRDGLWPLKGLGVIDDTRCHKGQEYWHVTPVWWQQGSPLSRWVEAGSVAVLNADTPALARAS